MQVKFGGETFGIFTLLCYICIIVLHNVEASVSPHLTGK